MALDFLPRRKLSLFRVIVPRYNIFRFVSVNGIRRMQKPCRSPSREYRLNAVKTDNDANGKLASATFTKAHCDDDGCLVIGLTV